MRKLFILLTLGILAIVIFPVVALADKQGSAQMHSVNLNQSNISGIMTFLDDGTDLYVLGTATGMNSNETYVSLIYDNGSVPAGPDACEPTPGNRLPSMFVGTWVVDAAGKGGLDVVKTNVVLKDFRTISIRRTIGPNPFPPPTTLRELEACGVVVTHKVKKLKK